MSSLFQISAIIPHEEVVTLLAEDTLSSIVTVGIGDKARRFSCGPVAQMVHLFLQVT